MSFQRESGFRSLHSFPTRRSSDLRERACHKTGQDQQGQNERSDEGNDGFHVNGISCLIQGWLCRGCWRMHGDRKSTRLNSSHITTSYAVFCLKKKKTRNARTMLIT